MTLNKPSVSQLYPYNFSVLYERHKGMCHDGISLKNKTQMIETNRNEQENSRWARAISLARLGWWDAAFSRQIYV